MAVSTGEFFGYLLLVIVIIRLLICPCLPDRNLVICCMNVLRCCYDFSPLRCNCASYLEPNEAIGRYEEDPPQSRDAFVQTLITNDYIKSIVNSFARMLPEYFLSILPSGSLREGFGKVLPSTAVLASDYDVMLVPDAVCAGEEDAVYGFDEERPLFTVVESREIDPGYVWLRLENQYLTQWERLCLRRQTSGIGCSYLSSHKIHDLLRNVFITSECIQKTNENYLGKENAAGKIVVEQNGPALTIKITKEHILKRKCINCHWNCLDNLRNCSRLERDALLFYCDFTVALYCPQWPKKSDWSNQRRRNNWPSRDVVDQIMKIGCHVVPKPSTESLIKLHQEQPLSTTYSQSPGLEWRYSFSQPEILLSENVAPEARSAYLALKAVNKRYISLGMIQGLQSFVLKCLLFRFMEEHDQAFWDTHPTPFDIFTQLLDSLRLHLTNGSFPHYWIEEIDLLRELDWGTKQILLNRCDIVRRNPTAYIADNWLELTRCLRRNCCVCCSFHNNQRVGAGFCKSLAGLSSSCPCCLVPCKYNDTNPCVGPCPYDRINMDVY